MFEDCVNFVASTKLVIKDEKIVKRKLRYEITLQHTTQKPSSRWASTNQMQCSNRQIRTDRQTDRYLEI